MKSIRGKNGGISVYLSITAAALMIVLSMLLNSVLAGKEKQIAVSGLLKCQELLLADFDKDLYKYYGLFATAIPDIHEKELLEMINRSKIIDEYSVQGRSELSGEVLLSGIIRFTRPRFPVQLFTEAVSRINKIQRELNAIVSDEYDSRTGIIPGEFEEILDLLIRFCNDNTTVIQEKTAEIVQAYETQEKSIQLLLGDKGILNKSISDMCEYLEDFYSFRPGPIYSSILLDHYASKMFSCRTDHTNLRDELISEGYHETSYEIEKIIFGNENEEQNKLLAELCIGSARITVRLLCNLLDAKKMEEIKAIAAAICAFAALVSGGSAVIPPETAEAAVLVIMSSIEGIRDCEKLFKGGTIAIIPVKGAEKIEISYLDHLSLMLFAVPDEKKLQRIERIIYNNLYMQGRIFYTGVSISCRIYGSSYHLEKFYYGR